MKDFCNVYYVYEHWRPDTGKCFYVGKGKARRAWSMRVDRNIGHMSVVSELTSKGFAVDVRIIVRDISSEESFKIEKQRIAIYGVENLTNMNRGGGGVIRHSPEALAKISATSKGRRVRLGMKSSIETKALLREIGIASIDTFRKYTHLGPETLSKAVICVDDGMRFDSASSAARHYALSKTAIIELCNGYKSRRKTVGGRVFKYAEAA